MKDNIRPHGLSKNGVKKHLAAKRAAAITATPDVNMPLPDININLTDEDKTSSRLARFKKLNPKHHWYNFNRNEKIMAAVGAALVLMGLTTSIYYLFIHKPTTHLNNKIIATKIVPTTVAAPLTGLPIDPALAKRPVTGIMIENSFDARPQSGLQDAGVVYEAIAEGGITRFIALFQDTRPQYVGPVRSLRPYYIDFATPFDASIAHVGGSPDALAQIRGSGKDLDQFFNAGSYWRQPTRDAPHNVYTSFDRLDSLNQSKGYVSSDVQSWLRKRDSRLKTPTAKTIDLNISSAVFNVHYDYDAGSNSYLRSEGGKPHLATTSADNATGQQLKPKVVISLVIGYGIASDGQHSVYSVDGTGTAFVFQDGGVTQGTWYKASRGSQFEFKDSAGNPIKLTAGQTWLTILDNASKVSYAP